jgi:hypothetical protein
MKSDIDVGKTFKAKDNVTSSALNPDDKFLASAVRSGVKEKLYLERGAQVEYLGTLTEQESFTGQPEARIKILMDGKKATLALDAFNRLFERA